MASASPLPPAIAAAPAAAAPATAAAARTPTADMALPATDTTPATAVDAGALFGLLLGTPADPAAPAGPVSAAPARAPAKPAAPDAAGVPETVDPLAVVLSQMPALQPIAPTPATPALPATPPPTAVPGPLQQTAVARSEAAPAASAPGPAPDADVAASEFSTPARFTLASATAAAPTAALPLQTAQVPVADADVAAPRLEPTPAGLVAPLHAAQAAPVPQQAAPAVVAPPVLQQPADAAAGYDERFGSHVAMLAGQRIGHAEIRVSPEHLGTIDIRLQLDGNEVRAEFHSAQAEVRQALEASLPRLRDMLGQHGLQLAHAGVGHGHGQKGQGQQSEGGAPAEGNGDGLAPRGSSKPGTPLPPDFRRSRGLLDVYA